MKFCITFSYGYYEYAAWLDETNASYFTLFLGTGTGIGSLITFEPINTYFNSKNEISRWVLECEQDWLKEEFKRKLEEQTL